MALDTNSLVCFLFTAENIKYFTIIANAVYAEMETASR
jgi:hypothetical protein